MHLNKTVYKLPSALAVVDIDWLLELDGQQFQKRLVGEKKKSWWLDLSSENSVVIGLPCGLGIGGFKNLLPCDSSVQTRQRTTALKLIALITGKSLGLLYATGVLKQKSMVNLEELKIKDLLVGVLSLQTLNQQVQQQEKEKFLSKGADRIPQEF